MRFLVTGAKGQLGFDVLLEVHVRGHEALGVDIEELDITDALAVEQTIRNMCPDVVIYCAAYTAVDAAEDNVELCRKINVFGTKSIASICGELGIKMIYISTDYVFDGKGTLPWEPDEHDIWPLNVYGQSKYDGELAVLEYVNKYYIVRASWVFGEIGKNFVKTMLRLSRDHDILSVVNDQIGSPTYTRDFAKLLVDMAELDRYGIYHATNEGFCSWYEFATEIFKRAEIDTLVKPVTSEAYPTKAKRPLNSRLSKDKLDLNGFHRLPAWQDAVQRYLEVKR